MPGIVFLILRIILAVLLYAFLGWAMLTIWRELRVQGQLISAPVIPNLSIRPTETGAGDGKILDIPEVHIGRGASNEYAIADETVSLRHARLSYHHNQWWVEDLKSTNGTYLNDERVTVPTVIVSGDELRCGQARLNILVDEKNR